MRHWRSTGIASRPTSCGPGSAHQKSAALCADVESLLQACARGFVFRAPPPTGDEVAYLITLVSALSIFLITACWFIELYTNSALSRHKFGWDFLVTTTWDPVAGQFGALPFIYGTVVTSALALLIAVPLGVGAAIFLAELAPPESPIPDLSDRAAGRCAQRDLSACWDFRAGSGAADTSSRRCKSVWDSCPLFQRTVLRRESFCRRVSCWRS